MPCICTLAHVGSSYASSGNMNVYTSEAQARVNPRGQDMRNESVTYAILIMVIWESHVSPCFKVYTCGRVPEHRIHIEKDKCEQRGLGVDGILCAVIALKRDMQLARHEGSSGSRPYVLTESRAHGSQVKSG